MKVSILAAGSVVLSIMALASSGARAGTVTLTTGDSTQQFVETGLGESTGDYANWSLTQGACGSSAVLTTCTLSGAYTGGNYSFVTTYATTAPATPPTGIGYAPGPTSVLLSNYFGYSFLSSSTNMVLTLTPTSGPATVVDLVTRGQFDAGTSFSFAGVLGTQSCTGVAVGSCDPFDVGVVPKATISSLETITVSYTTPVPIPAAIWLMLSGMGGLAALGRKRKAVA